MFSTIAFAILAVAPALIQAQDCTRTYTVQAGDFCDSISAAHNVSTYQLAALNSGTINDACSNLAIGQQLCLGTANEDCTTTYVVQPGDFCDGLLSNFGINGTILYANNPQINSDCSNLYTGEVLCAANQVLVPAVPVGSVGADPTDLHPSASPASTTLASSSTPIASASPASTTLASSSTPAPSPSSTPSLTPAPTTPTTSSSAPSPSASDDGDDGDESNLPFCDEL